MLGSQSPASFENQNGNQNVRAQTFVYITNPQRVEHKTFSIVKPKDWKETEYNSALIYLPPNGNLNDAFSEKFSMMGGFIPENETRSFKEITLSEIENSKSAMPNLQVIEFNETARLGRIDAIKVVLNTKIQNRTLVITQLRALQGNKAYAFSMQCEERCADSNIFYEMAQSFEWKNP